MSTVPVRISDADREHAAGALGEHFATGRLSKEEYDERAQRVWEAKFHADLEPLFSDLPSPWTRVPAQVRPVRALPQTPSRRPAGSFMPLAPLVVGLVAVAIITGVPWLLFGLFWLCALGGGPARARQFRAHRAAYRAPAPWRT